jgi:hypothetical protein
MDNLLAFIMNATAAGQARFSRLTRMSRQTMTARRIQLHSNTFKIPGCGDRGGSLN